MTQYQLLRLLKKAEKYPEQLTREEAFHVGIAHSVMAELEKKEVHDETITK